jgi:hypothetical protein
MSDSTFRAIVPVQDVRSVKYQEYRQEWEDRETTLNPGVAPLHLDIETVAVCDLRCGATKENPTGFCQIWTHEHQRKLGFEGVRKPGYIDGNLFYELLDVAHEHEVKSLKLNYRGEPSLHEDIVTFVEEAASPTFDFVDIMMNTNGNGGARKNPNIFADLVQAGVTNLMFSVDAMDKETYEKQRVNGKWETLLYSVDSAVRAKPRGVEDLRIRASAVRTRENHKAIDSGDFEKFWLDRGIDWVSVSECYYPDGVEHDWQAAVWRKVNPVYFTCADPFRRMVVTWDGKFTFPCCQGFSAEVNGGEFVCWDDFLKCWHSNNFNELRLQHIEHTWNQNIMCVNCPLTREVVRRWI